MLLKPQVQQDPKVLKGVRRAGSQELGKFLDPGF